MAKERGSRRGFYIAVVVLCAATCLILIYCMFFGSKTPTGLSDVPTVTPAAGSLGKTELSFTEEQLEGMVSAAMPSDVKVENLDIRAENNALAVAGDVSKDTILTYLDQAEGAGAAAARAAVSLLPETIPLGASVGVDTADGQLEVTPKSVTVGGITLDAGLLPKPLLDSVTTALNDAVAQYGTMISGIRAADGTLTIGMD